MTETQLENLADEVASVLEQRQESTTSVLAAVGSAALFAGAAFVVVKLVQNVNLRRQLRKLNKKS